MSSGAGEPNGASVQAARTSHLAIVVACVAFGLFWGNNTVVFAGLLQSAGFDALIQMLWRSLFFMLLVPVLATARRLPVGLTVAALIVQVAVVASDIPAGPLPAVQLARLIAYAGYMSFFLVAFALYFFTLPKRVAPFAVFAAFVCSYLVSTLYYSLGTPPLVRALASLAATCALVAGLARRGLLARRRAARACEPASAHAPEPAGSPDVAPLYRLRNTYRTIAGSFVRIYGRDRGATATMGVFGGSVVLLLLVFQIWFQLSNLDPAARSEYATPLYGALSIVGLCALFAPFVRAGSRTIALFPIVSLGVFVLSQVAVLVWWEQALLIMSVFTGIWFAAFQLVLMLHCGELSPDGGLADAGAGPSADPDPAFPRAARYSFGMGACMLVLAVGNAVARIFLGDAPLGYGDISTLAFVMMLFLVVTFAAETFALVKRTAERSAANAGDPGAQDAAPMPAATPDRTVDALCARYGVTPRERAVLQMYITGRTATHIAVQLSLSESTVKTYLRRIYAKCDVHSREELLDLLEAL